ncbi:MAG: hypothetical protein ACOZIN_21060 [Myxococcota bacterium]
MKAAGSLCCDASVKMLYTVGYLNDEDKYTMWCAVANDTVETDVGVAVRCGWAKCKAFEEFWPKFRKQPDAWFGAK